MLVGSIHRLHKVLLLSYNERVPSNNHSAEERPERLLEGRPEGRKAENYVRPLFFEKAGDKKH